MVTRPRFTPSGLEMLQARAAQRRPVLARKARTEPSPTAQAVGQAQVHRLLTTPKQATEHLRRFFQAIATAFFHQLNELRVNLVQHGLCVLALRFGLRTKGVQKSLVRACRHQTALNAQLVHEFGEPKAVHQHANAAHNAGLVHINLVCSGRNVISG